MAAVRSGFREFLFRFAIASSALYATLHGRFTTKSELLGAVSGGILIAAGWGTLMLITALRARIELLLASKLQLLPEDGKLSTAIGRIQAMGTHIATPFGNRKCVAFTYSIYERITITTRNNSSVTTQQRKRIHMGGFSACPSKVQTSNTSVNVLGFPLPDNFPAEGFSAARFRNKILNYVQRKGIAVGRAHSLRQVQDEMGWWSEEPTSVRAYDWRDAKLEDVIDSPLTYIEEKFIPVNAQVCVFGIYSSARGGLLPELGQQGIEVLHGTAEDGIRDLRRRCSIFVSVATVCFALGTVGVYAALAWI